eukprot:646186-Rhodomonas_salina.2
MLPVQTVPGLWLLHLISPIQLLAYGAVMRPCATAYCTVLRSRNDGVVLRERELTNLVRSTASSTAMSMPPIAAPYARSVPHTA